MSDDGLDYDEVAAVNISKDDMVNLFVDPKTSKIVDYKSSNYQLNGAQMRLCV